MFVGYFEADVSCNLPRLNWRETFRTSFLIYLMDWMSEPRAQSFHNKPIVSLSKMATALVIHPRLSANISAPDLFFLAGMGS
jgi:hypothetical protein